ncbi:MAG: phage holin family protein [Clostridia bacterium]|nr:phage holin family protein [Clostridia bacterium]
MNYIIMLLIVIGLALADFATGFIKAYCNNDVSSSKMRKGGLNKLCEIIVMTVAVGLDFGIEQLGKFYSHSDLTAIAGMVTAVSVFVYIAVMEVVSILENFAEINPQAKWVRTIICKLKVFSGGEANENETDDKESE